MKLLGFVSEAIKLLLTELVGQYRNMFRVQTCYSECSFWNRYSLTLLFTFIVLIYITCHLSFRYTLDILY